MSEEKVQYETGDINTYLTHHDIYERFLEKTGIDPAAIESWEVYGRTGEIKIWLNGGGSIIYNYKES